MRIVDRPNSETEEIPQEGLKNAVFPTGKKKAPVFDDIAVESLCEAWPLVKDRLRGIELYRKKSFLGIGRLVL